MSFPAPRALLVLLAASPMLVAPPSTAAPVPTGPSLEARSAAADTQVVDIHATLDWNVGRVTLDPIESYWSFDLAGMDDPEDYYVVSEVEHPTSTPELRRSQITVARSGRYFIDEWEAPRSFTFDVSDAPYAERTYRVSVVVINAPERPKDPEAGDIAVPATYDAVTDDDVGGAFDGGFPVQGVITTSRDYYLTLLEPGRTYSSDVNGPIGYEVGALNAQMARYFVLRVPESFDPGAVPGDRPGDRISDWSYVELDLRAGAPTLPLRYWDEPWFEVGYDVIGRQYHPATREVYRDYRVAHTARFGEPGYSLTSADRTARSPTKVGMTSQASIMPPARTTHGLVGGTLRVHILRTPTAVSGEVAFKAVNPKVATQGSLPRLAMKVLTAQALKLRSVAITYRSSALTRAGERVYSAPRTMTWVRRH